MNYLLQAGFTLVQFIFGIYLIIVMVRFLLQLVKADFYNPISQTIVKLTSPPLRILRRFYTRVCWYRLAIDSFINHCTSNRNYITKCDARRRLSRPTRSICSYNC